MTRTEISQWLSMTVGDEEVCFRFMAPGGGEEMDSGAIEAQLAGQMRDHPEHFCDRRFNVDLSNMPALSSSHLGALLAIRNALGGNQTVLLSNLRPNVREALRVTHLGDLFEWQ